MSVKTKEEIMTMIKERIGDNSDDSTLAFLEDVSDTLEKAEQKDETDWKAKYEENDKQWRQKYRDRFFSNEPEGTQPLDDEPEEPKGPKTFDDLFSTKED